MCQSALWLRFRVSEDFKRVILKSVSVLSLQAEQLDQMFVTVKLSGHCSPAAASLVGPQVRTETVLNHCLVLMSPVS